MAKIEFKGLTKRFGSLTAVDNLNLTIPDKSFVALLGPSGCGKSTTMNMIAGIEEPSDGQILFDGSDIVSVPIDRRGVGYVFQNYAIFTHMSVYDNLAFGLQVRGLPKVQISAKVRQVAELMRLEDRLDWPSGTLSVNEMQKLAIGRSAIVEPSIFLLDEPLSNLDAAFREFMRTELKHIQRQLEQTMIYVTHDQIEAMSLADHIAVMNHGVLQQYDTPADIYSWPANTFVANFIGSPSMNLIPCQITTEGGTELLDVGSAGRIAITDDALRQAARAAPDRDVILGVRPEVLELVHSAATGPGLQLEVDLLEPIGPRTVVHLRSGDTEILAVKDKRYGTQELGAVTVIPPQAACRLFDRRDGRVLGGA